LKKRKQRKRNEMGLKVLPYHLRFGFIAGIIFILLYIISYKTLSLFTPISSFFIFQKFFIYIFSGIFDITIALNISIIICLILDLLLWITIGTLIGYLYSKFRKKR
jgi:hypothetical protein